ncbi:hypothetical protein JCM33374_g396 [Metschnikowia sp. JCM 33374]|nr:hypothetical protein JCM33374_g396 [Metschnikowia sp. JCM 33374]
MVYGGYLCWTLLKDESHKSGWWHTITRTSQANKIGGILLILAAVFSVVVSAFVGLHFRYMYLGVTTNEADKWGEIEYLVELGLLFHVSDLDIYVERATIRNDTDGSYAVVYISLDDQRVLFSDDESHGHVLQKITSVTTDLTNIYDRGFLENIRGRLLV